MGICGHLPVKVSTHASVRRRLEKILVLTGRKSFNSRLREEATIDDIHFTPLFGGFNSRLREEATVGMSSRMS